MLQCFRCKKVDDDTRRALKMSLKKKKARPMSVDELKQGRFLDLASKQFFVKEISKDGHCLFAAFAAGIKRVIGEDVTVKSLRSKVADFLLSSKGQVPGMVYAQFTQLSDGSIVTDPSASLQIARNIGHAPITLEQYAAKVRKDLYGGDLEIATLACVFQVSIHVYSWIYFNDSNVFQPEYYGSGQQHVALLFQQDFSSAKGAQDHYDLIVADQFWKWRKCMNAMPVWKKDLGICNSLKGRGIQALRDFEPDEVLLWYDGGLILQATSYLQGLRSRNCSKGSICTMIPLIFKIHTQCGWAEDKVWMSLSMVIRYVTPVLMTSSGLAEVLWQTADLPRSPT
jgi:hypothetical protein